MILEAHGMYNLLTGKSAVARAILPEGTLGNDGVLELVGDAGCGGCVHLLSRFYLQAHGMQ